MAAISDLSDGERFAVEKVVLSGEIGKRLADMGFTRGAQGHVVRSALFGDPLQVRIWGYDVSLRRSEAKGVEIRTLGQRRRHRRRHGQMDNAGRGANE